MKQSLYDSHSTGLNRHRAAEGCFSKLINDSFQAGTSQSCYYNDTLELGHSVPLWSLAPTNVSWIHLASLFFLNCQLVDQCQVHKFVTAHQSHCLSHSYETASPSILKVSCEVFYSFIIILLESFITEFILNALSTGLGFRVCRLYPTTVTPNKSLLF